MGNMPQEEAMLSASSVKPTEAQPLLAVRLLHQSQRTSTTEICAGH